MNELKLDWTETELAEKGIEELLEIFESFDEPRITIYFNHKNIDDIIGVIKDADNGGEIDENPELESLMEMKKRFTKGEDLNSCYGYYYEIAVNGEEVWDISEISKEEMIEEIISSQEWKSKR